MALGGASWRITFPGAVCACLVLAFHADHASGSVIIRTGNYTFDPIPSMPADFGPHVPEEGISGELVLADPEDACAPLAPPPSGGGGEGSPWVALIARSQSKLEHCTFDVKVRNAEGAGAAAAIVYDDVSEGLIIMSKPYLNPEPRIPALFVTQRSGLLMKKLLQAPGPTTVLITPLSGALWLSMLFSAFAACVAVSILLATLYMVRRQRGGAGADLPGAAAAGYGPMHQAMRAEQIRALPVVVHHGRQQEEAAAAAQQAEQQRGAGAEAVGGPGANDGSDSSSEDGRRGGGTRRSCAICLEAYEDGDKLRVLPCQHRYHTDCIDQWLSSRRPLCPVCKADASRPDVEAGAGGDAGGIRLLSLARTAVRGLIAERWLGRARSPDGAAAAGGEGSGALAAEAGRLLPEGPGSLRRQQSLPLAAAPARLESGGSGEIVPDLEAGAAPAAVAAPAVAGPLGAGAMAAVWGPGVAGAQADSSTEESELDSGAE